MPRSFIQIRGPVVANRKDYGDCIPRYRLIEYKANANLYYYQLDYPSSNFN